MSFTSNLDLPIKRIVDNSPSASTNASKMTFNPPSFLTGECHNFFNLFPSDERPVWIEKWNLPNFDRSQVFQAARQGDVYAHLAILGALLQWFDTNGSKTIFDLAAEHQYDANEAISCLDSIAHRSSMIPLLIADFKFQLAQNKHEFILNNFNVGETKDEAALALKMRWLCDTNSFELISEQQYLEIVESVNKHGRFLSTYLILAALHLSHPSACVEAQRKALNFLKEQAGQNVRKAIFVLAHLHGSKSINPIEICEAIQLYEQLLKITFDRSDILALKLHLLRADITLDKDTNSILDRIEELQTASDRIQINSELRLCDIANTYLAEINLKKARSYHIIPLLETAVKRKYNPAIRIISNFARQDRFLKFFLQKAKHHPTLKEGYFIVPSHIKPLPGALSAQNVCQDDLKKLYAQINFENPQESNYSNPWKLGRLLFGERLIDELKAMPEPQSKLKECILKTVELKLCHYLPASGQPSRLNSQTEAYQAYIKLTHIIVKIRAMSKTEAVPTLIQLLIECHGCPDQQQKGIDKLFNEIVNQDMMRSSVVAQIEVWAFDLRKACLEDLADRLPNQISFFRRLIGYPAGAIMEFDALHEDLDMDWIKPMEKQAALDAFHQSYNAETLVHAIYMHVESFMALQAMKKDPSHRKALDFLMALFVKATDELGLEVGEVLDLSKTDPNSENPAYIFSKEGIRNILHRLGMIEKAQSDVPLEFDSKDFPYCLEDTSWIPDPSQEQNHHGQEPFEIVVGDLQRMLLAFFVPSVSND